MPKVPTTGRKPAMPSRVLRPPAGTNRPLSHPLRSQPAPTGRPHPYASQATQTNVPPTTRRNPQCTQEVDPEFEAVHANCTRMIRVANERQQLLRSRLSEQEQNASDAERQFEAERAQFQATIRQLKGEKQRELEEARKAKNEASSLQQQLDLANTDVRNRITREELHGILRGIHANMKCATDEVSKRISESEKVSLDSYLPFPVDGQASWAEEMPNLGLPDDFLSAGVGIPTSIDPQNVSQFGEYVAVP